MPAARPILHALLAALVLLAALAVAQPASAPGDPALRLEKLEASVDLLGKRLLASRLEVDALQSEVGSLEARALLQQREIDRLSERLASLESSRGARRR